MSPIIYFLAQYYPFWGIPLALIAGEVANHSRRNSRPKIMILTGLLCLTCLALTALYFSHGGRATVQARLQKLEHRR